MKAYTVADARLACGPRFVFVDFAQCDRIEPDALALLRHGIRTNGPSAVFTSTDDLIGPQLEAIEGVLREDHADHSLFLRGVRPPPRALHRVLRGTAASLFLGDPVVEDDALLASIGAVDRPAVSLHLPARCGHESLTHLRQTEFLRLEGLRQLDGAGAQALLEGNRRLKHLELPELEQLTPDAAELMGEAGLQCLRLGPVFRHSPDARGWLGCTGRIHLDGLTGLRTSEAKLLAQSRASHLILDGRLDLPEATARHLAGFPGTLELQGLDWLSPAMATGLAGWPHHLILDPTRLAPEAAERLRSDQGELSVNLDGEDARGREDTVIALATTGGRHTLRLALGSDFVVTERAAAALALHPGQVHLHAGSPATPAAWSTLVALGGELSFTRVTLDPATADCLGRHRGPLSLTLTRMPGRQEAARLAAHPGGSLELRFPHAAADLTAEIGEPLARYQGLLTLRGVDSLDEETLRALERRRGDLEFIHHENHPWLKDAFARLEAAGALVRHEDA